VALELDIAHRFRFGGEIEYTKDDLRKLAVMDDYVVTSVFRENVLPKIDPPSQLRWDLKGTGHTRFPHATLKA
jgi:hypothetical protein